MIRTIPGRMPRLAVAARFLLCLPLGLVPPRPVEAGPIQFTGDVARDFNSNGSQPGIYTIPGHPGSVGESPYIIRNGWTTGFQIESARFAYDRPSDTLFAGIQTYSIAGDADGNGNPGVTSPQMAAAGGINFAHFGGDKSLTVAFANAGADGGHGPAVFVAGIPADKSLGDPRNTNEFTVATYADRGRGLAYSYGSILNGHVGPLAVDPSASMPNFEFAIANASSIRGFDPSAGFFVSLYLGSQRSIVAGKDSLDWARVPGVNPAPGGTSNHGGPIGIPSPTAPFGGPQPVPEPPSAVLLALGGLVAMLCLRRKLHASRPVPPPIAPRTI